MEDFKNDVRSRFKANFGKINYERALDLPYSVDFLVREVQINYGFSTMIYADFLKRDGEERLGNEFYEKAFEMGPPEGFLWPYVNFLLEDGREKEAFAFDQQTQESGRDIRRIRKAPRNRKAISVISEKTKQSLDDWMNRDIRHS